jgi:hypothetical protein
MAEEGVMRVLIVDDSASAGNRLIATFSKLVKAENSRYAEDVPLADKVGSQAGCRCSDVRFPHAYLVRSQFY